MADSADIGAINTCHRILSGLGPPARSLLLAVLEASCQKCAHEPLVKRLRLAQVSGPQSQASQTSELVSEHPVELMSVPVTARSPLARTADNEGAP